MDEFFGKLIVFCLIAGTIFYLGHDSGGDAIAAQYTGATQELLEILIRGQKASQ